ncbi:MAG: potassium channel family protein [Acidimicrobiia bacterium]
MAHEDSGVFSDDSRYLDRFGLLLVLSAAAVSVGSLVDLNEPTADLGNEIGWILASSLTAATLMVAARASGVGKRWTRIVDVVAVLAVVVAVGMSFAARLPEDSRFFVSAGRPSLVLVCVTVVSPVVVTRRLFLHKVITKQTLYGAVAAFLLTALGFSYAFQSISNLGGTPFFGQPEPTTSFMYFSVVTITTLGYGDLAPVGNFGRYLATAEAVIGQIFLVTVVARIVSLAGMAGFGFGTKQELSETPSETSSS